MRRFCGQFIVLLACAIPAASAFAEEVERVVTVTGTAVTRVAPDMLNWSVQINKLNPNLSEAKASSDADVKKVLELARELAVAADDLQTSQLRITREYDRDEQGNRKEFQGWSVNRSVTIRQRDLTRFDEFVDKLLASAELEINFNFDSTRRIELQEETRMQAVQAAQAKAKAMVEAANARIGRVLTLEEQNPNQAMFNQFSNNARFDMSAAQADQESGTFAPGAIEIKVSVIAKFEIM